MRYIVLISLLAFFLPGCASISRPVSVISNSVKPNSFALGDQDIHAGNGLFIFRDVMLDGDALPGSWIIKGVVRNGTDTDWSKVNFNIYLYDASGNILGGNINFFYTFF
jgi:hypothetical protein